VVAVAAAQVQLPARLLPAVEAGLGDEFQPVGLRHVAELAADQPDLVIRTLAETVRGRLLEAHGGSPVQSWMLPRTRWRGLYRRRQGGQGGAARLGRVAEPAEEQETGSFPRADHEQARRVDAELRPRRGYAAQGHGHRRGRGRLGPLLLNVHERLVNDGGQP